MWRGHFACTGQMKLPVTTSCPFTTWTSRDGMAEFLKTAEEFYSFHEERISLLWKGRWMNGVDLGENHWLSLGFPGSLLWDTDWKASALFGVGFQETLGGNTGNCRVRKGKENYTGCIFKPIITVGKWRLIPLGNPGNRNTKTCRVLPLNRKRELNI